MQLSFVALQNVIDVNHYTAVTEIVFQAGNPGTFYFQLVDLDQTEQNCGDPLRYMPPAGASVVVNFNNPDLALSFSRAASQPFGDTSIWAVALMPGDQIAFGGVSAVLTIGSSVYTLYPYSEITFQSTSDQGRNFC
jgi:hypothetical protein